MAYFIPSSIQKRLLRYALSRLELLDTDALDLERLDVTWGKKSTVELKDVGLRKDKLSSLLSLPERLKVKDAHVTLLRITIPADIHTSSIVVEAEELEVGVSVDDLQEALKDLTHRSKHSESASTKGYHKPRRKNSFIATSASRAHRGSDVRDRRHAKESTGSDGLTSQQLAESFLATEPAEEREQLEAVLNSRFEDLGRSSASSGSGEDELTHGIGTGFAIPGFLAAFLKGIGDRLQLLIRNVVLNLHVKLDVHNADGHVESLRPTSKSVTLTIRIRQVDVTEVRLDEKHKEITSLVSPENDRATPHRHKYRTRCIILQDIKGSLVTNSDASTEFSLHTTQDESTQLQGGAISDAATDQSHPGDLQSQMDIPSLQAFHNDGQLNKQLEDISASVLDLLGDAGMDMSFSPAEDGSNADEDASTNWLPPQGHAKLLHSQDLEGPMVDSVLLARWARNRSHRSDAGESRVSTCSPSDHKQTPSSPYLFSNQSQDLHGALEAFRKERALPLSTRSYSEKVTSMNRTGTGERQSSYRSRLHSTLFPATITDRANRSEQHKPMVAVELNGSNQSYQSPQVNSSATSTPNDELSESTLFSREEAASIYMSAMHDSAEHLSGVMRIPGSWDESVIVSGQVEQDSSQLPNVGEAVMAANVHYPETRLGNHPDLSTATAPRIEIDDRLDSNLSTGQNQDSSVESLAAIPKISSSRCSRKCTDLMKEFLFVNQASLCFPITDGSMEDKGANEKTPITASNSMAMYSSGYNAVPGAFSLYAENNGMGKQRQTPNQSHVMFQSDRTESTASIAPPNEHISQPVDFTVDLLDLRFNVSTSRSFAQLIKTLLPIFLLADTPDVKNDTACSPHNPTQPPGTSFQLHASRFDLSFVECSGGQDLELPESGHGTTTTSPVESTYVVVVAAKMVDVDLTVDDVTRLHSSQLLVGKLNLEVANQEVLSFSKDAKERSSIHDLQQPRGKDICVKFVRADGRTEVNVSTLLLSVIVDLQQIDDALGSFGGFSALLELGSSMTSDITMTSEVARDAHRARVVHFERSAKIPEKQTQPNHLRLNIRLGGAAVALKGKNCRLEYESTPIKLVGRDGVFRVQIENVRLSGPYVNSTSTHPDIDIRLRNLGFKLLPIPEEHDLTRLISLLNPSNDKFEEDDDILLDTLLSQRKKGSVLRTTISEADIEIKKVEAFQFLLDLVQEMSSQSTVTKYLPQDNQPGIMTFLMVDSVQGKVQTTTSIGTLSFGFEKAEFAIISCPLLIAVGLGKMSVTRLHHGIIVREVTSQTMLGQPPMLMARYIGDDLEPIIKLKLWNTCFEYDVPLAIALLDTPQDQSSNDGNHSAFTKPPSHAADLPELEGESPRGSGHLRQGSRSLGMDFVIRDCAIGLKPCNLPSKGLLVLTESHIACVMLDKSEAAITVELRKAALLIVDDMAKLTHADDAILTTGGEVRSQNDLVAELCRRGFVSVTCISAATAVIQFAQEDGQGIVDIEFRDELFLLETCADSTKTLLEIISALQPPSLPSTDQKYRTEVSTVQDMMASFTGDSFAAPVKDSEGRINESIDIMEEEEGDFLTEDELATDFDCLGELPDHGTNMNFESSQLSISENTDVMATNSRAVREEGQSKTQSSRLSESISGEVRPVSLPPQKQGNANKWDSTNNRYISVSKTELLKSPLNLRIRDLHIIWNLYDGYDWEKTRDTITKAVVDVETKAEERRMGRRVSEGDEEKESVIGDFLFNSIYIGIPINHDPRDLTRHINRNIDDLGSETGSHASTVTSRPSSSPRSPRANRKRLKLNRSKRHKIAFELRGVSGDIFVFPAGGETQSSIDLRVEDFDIFDHVLTSTWKKFATYMHDAGPREDKKPMIHLEICNVRPIPELTASELVVRVTVLPLRLHVDQDALDFITRFFDFKDDSSRSTSSPTEEPYLQRVEVRAIPVKLDYKPKKVDYAGIRSGRTTEFMNFFILDGADFVLKHTIIYGTSGFSKLHRSLEDVWMPDVRKNQLPSVLSGLNGVRTLVNMGSGVRDLVMIPITEYRKDGRIVRSISKGALSFARVTGSELTRFGAKLAIGAQTALQGAEDFLTGPSNRVDAGWVDADLDAEERRAISHYADQPAGILQGLKGAARSLERDLLLTKDVIIAISGEVRESGSAEDAAKAVVRNAPTLILRPMIGASKAISQTLMGATNTVDPQNRRRVDDKYKRY